VLTILKFFGIRGMTKRGDTPRYVESEPEAYTQSELDAMFAVCKPDYHVLFNFYLRTGFRMQEVRYLERADLDFENRTVRVKAKPEYGFVPKRWHERTIPLEEGLAVTNLALVSAAITYTIYYVPMESGGSGSGSDAARSASPPPKLPLEPGFFTASKSVKVGQPPTAASP
jgi:hypothetical protein